MCFLLDTRTETWLHDMIAKLGIRRNLLGEIRQSKALLAPLLTDLAAEFHLPTSLPVIVGRKDYPIALLGAGVNTKYGLTYGRHINSYYNFVKKRLSIQKHQM